MHLFRILDLIEQAATLLPVSQSTNNSFFSNASMGHVVFLVFLILLLSLVLVLIYLYSYFAVYTNIVMVSEAQYRMELKILKG